MEVLEGVLGVDQVARRLVSDADDTPGLPGAQGGSPAVVHSSVTVTFTLMVAVRLVVGSRGSDLHLRLVVAQGLVVQRCPAGLELPVALGSTSK